MEGRKNGAIQGRRNWKIRKHMGQGSKEEGTKGESRKRRKKERRKEETGERRRIKAKKKDIKCRKEGRRKGRNTRQK